MAQEVVDSTENNKQPNEQPISQEGLNLIIEAENARTGDVLSSGISEAEYQRYLMLQQELINESQVNNEEVNESNKYINFFLRQDISLNKSGILGMPFQFNEKADTRINKSHGRVYYQKIISNLPLVIFQVGRPLFMDSAALFGESKLQGVVSKVLALEDDEEQSRVMNSLASSGMLNDTRYYSFQDDFINYTSYVNTLCRFTAIKMGLTKYYNFDIKDIRNDGLIETLTGMNNYLAFYVTANTSYNESGSNSTGDSKLASAIKGLGGLKREIDFLFGGNHANVANLSDKNYNEAIGGVMGQLGVDPTSFLNRIISSGNTIASGGNLLFPEIWQDSSYRKSYSIDIKLYSPYGDKESIFLNVYVPFFSLLAMSLPRQNSKQGYEGPFIIKMFSKGWFNCDLGMIESIDVKKGGQSGSSWSIDSLPLEIDISLNVKDLYPTIMMTLAKGAGTLFSNNTGLVEYLNLMSGINLTRINPLKNLEAGVMMRLGRLEEFPEMTYTGITHKVSNVTRSLITKVLGGLN